MTGDRRPVVCPLVAAAVVLAVGCGGEAAQTPREYPAPVAATGGFDGPEAVKYDPGQGVYFVSSFGGSDDSLDNNGFISRLRADGSVETLRFIAGGSGGVTLHMPRGMTIHGDTLWVADADAIRGFDRRTGAALAVVDMTALAPGFLNDLTIASDGALYATDTDSNRIFRVAGGGISAVAADAAFGGPNGIAWDDAGRRFVVAPFRRGSALLSWRMTAATLEPLGRAGGGRYDGVELIGPDSVIAASQADSSLHLFTAGRGRPLFHVRGEPADIGWNPAGRLVAVPYIDRDTVEFFRIP